MRSSGSETSMMTGHNAGKSAHMDSQVKDPVCGRLIAPEQAQAVVTYQEVSYYLCCPLCQAEFERAPQLYAAGGSGGGNVVRPRPSLGRGLVEVYTGDGKGKTTAAFGLAMRAAGWGLRVHIVQFMKGPSRGGEAPTAGSVPLISLTRFGCPVLVDPEDPEGEDVLEAHAALRQAEEVMKSGGYDVVILDEVNVAVQWGLIPLEAVLALIKDKPAGVELVLTGRYAHPAVIACADLVTEMREVKHPYRQGLDARPGIEY